ncbi:MAG: hypothetical protein MZV70_54700 [Desulfobacterales bacterium]|nr:hypothetical protein [Desulfobacterales bacterium]
MLLLSQAEAYAAFMNPKFRPLTAAAAVGLCVLGGAFLIRPGGSTDARRTLCLCDLRGAGPACRRRLLQRIGRFCAQAASRDPDRS